MAGGTGRTTNSTDPHVGLDHCLCPGSNTTLAAFLDWEDALCMTPRIIEHFCCGWVEDLLINTVPTPTNYRPSRGKVGCFVGWNVVGVINTKRASSIWSWLICSFERDFKANLTKACSWEHHPEAELLSYCFFTRFITRVLKMKQIFFKNVVLNLDIGHKAVKPVRSTSDSKKWS